MTSDKIMKLLDKLKEATQGGRTRWAETADEDEFRVVFKTGMVRVGRAEAFDEDSGLWEKGYTATFLNRDGRVVEEFTRCRGEGHGLMAELFELARRSARRGDSLLDEMLAEVEGHGSGGQPSR